MRHRTLALALAAALSLTPALAAARTPQESLDFATALATRGDYEAGIKELDTVKSGAERGKVLLQKAEWELLTGKYADAVKSAKAALAFKDLKGSAGARLAQAYAAQGKTKDGIDAAKAVVTEKNAHRAKIVLGELLIRTGKRSEAETILREVITSYQNDDIKSTDVEGLTLAGRAAHLLRNAKSANSGYNQAEKAQTPTKNVELLLFRAELFLEKYNASEASAVIKQALKLEPRNPQARALWAKAKLEAAYDFDGAESEIRQALEVNPNLPYAFFVRAGLALRDLDIEAADAAADKGLAIDGENLELLSMKAAIRFLADDKKGFEAAKQKVLKLNPEYSTMYLIIADYAEWEHRYEEIVLMMKDAVAIDSKDAKAYASLGLNLIRSGDDKGGLEALDKAHGRDKYNVRVFNTLNLFDKIKTEYVDVRGQRFMIRYQKDEKAILERYVPQMLDEAYDSMAQRYSFKPKEPVSIELYADGEHFSVRTSGLPNVGIQGVCFGQTLAALSPAAAPFNWGNVVWHELGHVFAIQQSKNHVPRWFTEGLSEYETIVRRTEWQREEDPGLYAALKAGRIPKVASFNRAFTHVDSVEEVIMAYYAASQIVVFMAKEFGFNKLPVMLTKWGEGKRTPDVIQESLGVTPEELDKRYRAFLDKKLERYKKQYVPDLHAPPLDDARKAAKAEPKSAKKLMELALALYADGQGAEGDAMVAEVLKLDPKQPEANYVKFRKAMKAKDRASAQKILDSMIAAGHDGYALRMKAADLAEAEKDVPKQKKNLEAAAQWDPMMAEPLQALYDLASKAKDKDGMLAALRRLSALDQNDRRVWNRLLRLLVEKGVWEEARQVGESTMFVDVANPEAHRLYARALARTGKFVSAVYELNSAIICKPGTKELIEIYGELAKAYAKLKEPEMEKQALEYKTALEKIPSAGDKKDDKDKKDKKKGRDVDVEET